jgi:hypothetical protein
MCRRHHMAIWKRQLVTAMTTIPIIRFIFVKNSTVFLLHSSPPFSPTFVTNNKFLEIFPHSYLSLSLSLSFSSAGT